MDRVAASILETKYKIILLILLWSAVFWPVYPSLVASWFADSNNTPGVLVPLTSALLIWIKRTELALEKVIPSSAGGWLLAGSLLLYVTALAGGVAVVERLMIVFSLVGLILFNFGYPIYRLLRYPLFHNLFMIPVPDSIIGYVSFPLQLFATKASVVLINLFQIPVYREGNMLYFATTQLEVAEACSGIRSLATFLMLGCLFAYFLSGSWRKRIILVLSAIPLAVLTNIIRVAGTGILAHFYGAKVARGFLHEFSGLVVFAFGLIMIMAIFSILNAKEKNGS